MLKAFLLVFLLAGCADTPTKPTEVPQEIAIQYACGQAYARYRATQECAEMDNCTLVPNDIVQFRSDEQFLFDYCQGS